MKVEEREWILELCWPQDRIPAWTRYHAREDSEYLNTLAAQSRLMRELRRVWASSMRMYRLRNARTGAIFVV